MVNSSSNYIDSNWSKCGSFLSLGSAQPTGPERKNNKQVYAIQERSSGKNGGPSQMKSFVPEKKHVSGQIPNIAAALSNRKRDMGQTLGCHGGSEHSSIYQLRSSPRWEVPCCKEANDLYINGYPAVKPGNWTSRNSAFNGTMIYTWRIVHCHHWLPEGMNHLGVIKKRDTS